MSCNSFEIEQCPMSNLLMTCSLRKLKPLLGIDLLSVLSHCQYLLKNRCYLYEHIVVRNNGKSIHLRVKAMQSLFHTLILPNNVFRITLYVKGKLCFILNQYLKPV